MVSYVLTFMLGATVGGLVTVFAVACCVVASEHGAKAADAVSKAASHENSCLSECGCDPCSSFPCAKVGGTDE